MVEELLSESAHPMLEQTPGSYSKSAVHGMVWVSALQIIVTRTWFIEMVKNAFVATNSDNLEINEFPFIPNDRSYWRLITRAWEKIHYVSLGLFGPYLLIGLFNLSDILSGLGAFYIEHVIGNLYIPAFIYMAWQYFSLIVQEEEWNYVVAFAAYIFYQWWVFLFMMLNGTNAMYYLNDAQSNHADRELYPSLFYLINWLEHTARL